MAFLLLTNKATFLSLISYLYYRELTIKVSHNEISSQNEMKYSSTKHSYEFQYDINLKAEYINTYINQLYREVQPFKEEATSAFIQGMLWFAVGGLISILSYSYATANGEEYVVLSGAIVFGSIQTLRGLARYFKIHRAIKNVEAEMWQQI